MKKTLLFGALLTGALLMSGCGSSHHDDYYEPEPDPDITTLFLIDQDGNSYGAIPYICDSMVDWSMTRPNGEFTFIQPDNCRFDFTGLYGNYGDPLNDDMVFIVDDLDRGKGDIPYECQSFGSGTTYLDGSFEYDADDQCVFYL